MVWYHLPTTLDILSICPRTVHASLLVWNHDSRILLLIDVVIRYGTRDSHNAYKQCHKCSLQSANTKVGHRFGLDFLSSLEEFLKSFKLVQLRIGHLVAMQIQID